MSIIICTYAAHANGSLHKLQFYFPKGLYFGYSILICLFYPRSPMTPEVTETERAPEPRLSRIVLRFAYLTTQDVGVRGIGNNVSHTCTSDYTILTTSLKWRALHLFFLHPTHCNLAHTTTPFSPLFNLPIEPMRGGALLVR